MGNREDFYEACEDYSWFEKLLNSTKPQKCRPLSRTPAHPFSPYIMGEDRVHVTYTHECNVKIRSENLVPCKQDVQMSF